jgi:hypothetical protein
MIAPGHFRRNDAGGYYYVYNQPATPEERAKCMEALAACPVSAIGCDGQVSWWRRFLGQMKESTHEWALPGRTSHYGQRG